MTGSSTPGGAFGSGSGDGGGGGSAGVGRSGGSVVDGVTQSVATGIVLWVFAKGLDAGRHAAQRAGRWSTAAENRKLAISAALVALLGFLLTASVSGTPGGSGVAIFGLLLVVLGIVLALVGINRETGRKQLAVERDDGQDVSSSGDREGDAGSRP